MSPPRLRTATVATVGVAVLALLLAGSGGHKKNPAGPPAQHRSVAATSGATQIDPGDVASGCRAPNQVLGSQVEPYLAVSPKDPELLVAVWQQDRFTTAGAAAIAVAVSRDSARTWSVRQLPAVTGCAGGGYRFVSDPQVGIGPDGRIYVSVIAVGAPGQAVMVSSSIDFGQTWSGPRLVRRVADGSAILDKPALLVDRYRPGTAYEVWVEYPRPREESLSALRVDSAFVARSQDGGHTWSAPTRLYGSNTENQNHVPLELADGSLIDVFVEAYRLSIPSPSAEQVRVVRSRDGGRTWTAPVTAARFPFSVVRAGNGHPVRASGQDLSAYAQGRSVYVSWEYNTTGRSEIGVAYSRDGGESWARASDPVDGPVVAFLPEIAADPEGDIALTWYQTATTAGDPTTLDVGELTPGSTRWNASVAIGRFSLDRAVPAHEGYFLGDYEGLTPVPCGFRALDSIATAAGTRIMTVALCS